MLKIEQIQTIIKEIEKLDCTDFNKESPNGMMLTVKFYDQDLNEIKTFSITNFHDNQVVVFNGNTYYTDKEKTEKLIEILEDLI